MSPILGADTYDDFFHMSFDELMNVDITTAGKKPEKVEDVPASVVIITHKDIETYGYRSLIDILQHIPGFYAIDDKFWLGSTNFGIRGFFSTGSFNDVFIMINGINQIGDTYSDFSDAKINVPVEAIERIEIIRGPMSVMYGSGAFLGAINIITKSDEGASRENRISASCGTLNSYGGFARFSGENDKIHYTFNGAYYRNDGIDEPFTAMTNNASFLEHVGLSSTSTTKNLLSDRRKYFDVSGAFNDLSIDANYTETTKGVFDGMPSIGDGTNIFINSTNISLEYRKKLSPKLSLSGEVGYFYHHFSWQYEMLKKDFYATNNTNTSAYEVELKAFYNALSNLDFICGVNQRTLIYFYQTYDYPAFGAPYTNTELMILPNKKPIRQALFAQANYHIIKNLQLTAGVRLEKQKKYDMILSAANETDDSIRHRGTYDNDDVKVIPRFAVIYSWRKTHIFKLLYGEAIKQPSISQSFTQLHSDRSPLSPAKVKTLEFNYLFLPTSSFMATFSLFRNKLDNLIVKRNIYNPTDSSWTLYGTNRGELSTNGIELTLKIHLFDNLTIDCSGTYQDSKNKESGFENIDLGYAPQFLGYLQAAYVIGNASIAFSGRYVDDMETMWDNDPINPDSGNYTPKGRIGDKIDGYFVSDINLRINNIVVKDLFVNIHVGNVFDQQVRYPTTTGNRWADKGTLGEGRMISASVGRDF